MSLRLVVYLDRFPELSETFVAGELAALRAQGHAVRVEAVARAPRPHWEAVTGVEAHFLADETRSERLPALAWLLARHPLGCLRDLRARPRWRREEPVAPLRRLAVRARRLAHRGEPYVHAHFAAGAALDAMRVAALVGVRWGVTCHAYEIYAEPANLVEKLRRADLPVSVCEYTVRDLERMSGRPVTKVVMGVDGEVFRRSTPPPGGRHVVAVGRLIEKKGFGVLVEAAATARVERVSIVGDGPLREALAARVAELGLEERVELVGAAPPDAVRGWLERADVVAVPCVIAASGDRDSMPLVAKEALAMGVPVVASEEVGLPEIVRPPWGSLVPPGDATALARALEQVLDRPPAERALAVRAGRAFVLAHADLGRETECLARAIAEVLGSQPRPEETLNEA